MSDASRLFTVNEIGHQIRARADDEGVEPSAKHDEVILNAARRAARDIGRRRNGRSLRVLYYPVSIAAAVLLGISLGRAPWLWHERASQQLQLTIPAELDVRGQTSTPPARSAVPVEEADPSVWYRYIQELVFSGQTEAAEQHLRRFRELHPDFVYQP
jgi:hypothetical protein